MLPYGWNSTSSAGPAGPAGAGWGCGAGGAGGAGWGCGAAGFSAPLGPGLPRGPSHPDDYERSDADEHEQDPDELHASDAIPEQPEPPRGASGDDAICETDCVEDIVAVELTTTDGHVCYFITWGRIQSPVKPEPLEKLICNVAPHFAVGGMPAKARLCLSLQDAREAPYFYEALLSFAQQPIPFGPDYEKWRRRINRRMRQGREIYFLGPYKPTRDDEGGTIAFGAAM